MTSTPFSAIMRPSMRTILPAAIAALTLAACDKAPEPSKEPAKAAASSAPRASAIVKPAFEPPSRLPAAARIVAIGDVHGDLAATRAALKLGGLVDDKDRWAGKDSVLVQTGDQLDRGDDERAILDLLDRLEGEAKAAGGAVITLNGNHEIMNVQGDYRYVTPAGLKDFAGVPGALSTDPRLERVPEPSRARAAAFLPGAPYAKRMAKRGLTAIVGDNVFVHGGVSPKHLRYGLDRLNREASAWMNGDAREVPAIITGEDGPIWLRRYSAAADPEDCRVLRETLAMIPAKRMIVGHTPQRSGISPACNDAVWRIDVGLARHYGGKPEVLEIKGDEVKVLK